MNRLGTSFLRISIVENVFVLNVLHDASSLGTHDIKHSSLRGRRLGHDTASRKQSIGGDRRQ